MRVLVVLQDRAQDEDVVSAVQHLLREGDEARLLMVLPPSRTRETMSRGEGAWAVEPSSVPTATGLLLPSQVRRPLPAESEAQAVSRARAEANAALERYARQLRGRLRADTEVRVAASLVDDVLAAALEHRAHGIAIGAPLTRRLAGWLKRDPVQGLTQRAQVPVLVLGGAAHVPRPAPLAVEAAGVLGA